MKNSTIAFVGDVHSNLRELNDFIEKRPYLKAVVQIGDLGYFGSRQAAKADGDWKRFPDFIEETIDSRIRFKIPVYYIHGNHDDWGNLRNLPDSNVRYLGRSGVTRIEGLDIAYLSGIHSPKKFSWPARSLVGKHQKYYTSEDVESLKKNIEIYGSVDVLITHEGALKYLPRTAVGGSEVISDLVDFVKPKWYIHGHHHVNYYLDNKHTQIQGLGLFAKFPKSYKII